VKSSHRVNVSPGTALAFVALFFALGGSAFAVGEHVQSQLAVQKRCANGAVRGIAYVTGNPAQGIANTPDQFASTPSLFGRRFNCTGKATQVRRVDRGVYEVRFVGISGASAVGSGTGDTYATVEPAAGGAFKVTLHPAGRDDRVDTPFTVVAT
jgi:hypothetical protein